MKEFIAAGAAGMLAISAEFTIEDATSVAKAASEIGVARMIVTGLDVGRYLGAALSAADATKLALVSASITPHFGFGLRAFTPENSRAGSCRADMRSAGASRRSDRRLPEFLQVGYVPFAAAACCVT